MTVLIISIVAAWIFIAVIVWFTLARSRQISRMEEPFRLSGRWTQEELDAAEAGAKEMKKLWDEQHGR